MAGQYQGFVIVRNLEENPIDRNALNNLGGSPIADDINLFINNKRNVSTLSVALSNINSTTNKISYVDRDVVYTTGTKVIHKTDGLIYYIKNSNGLNEFQLSEDELLQTTVPLNSTFVGDYERSDEVTFENITNLKKTRRLAINQTNDQKDPYIPDAFSAVVKDEIAASENNIDNYLNVKSNALVSDKTFSSDINFYNVGHFRITDPDGLNNTNLSTTSGPGIFIYNSVSGTKVRAFSDTQNVWENNIGSTYLQTTASKITMGALKIESPSSVFTIQQKTGSTQDIVISATTPTNITTIEPNAVFRFKMKISINDEDYFLCLSNTAVVP